MSTLSTNLQDGLPTLNAQDSARVDAQIDALLANVGDAQAPTTNHSRRQRHRQRRESDPPQLNPPVSPTVNNAGGRGSLWRRTLVYLGHGDAVRRKRVRQVVLHVFHSAELVVTIIFIALTQTLWRSRLVESAGLSEWDACSKPLGAMAIVWLVKCIYNIFLDVMQVLRARRTRNFAASIVRRSRIDGPEADPVAAYPGASNPEIAVPNASPPPPRRRATNRSETRANAIPTEPPIAGVAPGILYARAVSLSAVIDIIHFVLCNIFLYASISSCRISSPHLWWFSFATLCWNYAIVVQVTLMALAVFVVLPVVYIVMNIVLVATGHSPISPRQLMDPDYIKPDTPSMSQKLVDRIPLVLYIPTPEDYAAAKRERKASEAQMATSPEKAEIVPAEGVFQSTHSYPPTNTRTDRTEADDESEGLGSVLYLVENLPDSEGLGTSDEEDQFHDANSIAVRSTHDKTEQPLADDNDVTLTSVIQDDQTLTQLPVRMPEPDRSGLSAEASGVLPSADAVTSIASTSTPSAPVPGPGTPSRQSRPRFAFLRRGRRTSAAPQRVDEPPTVTEQHLPADAVDLEAQLHKPDAANEDSDAEYDGSGPWEDQWEDSGYRFVRLEGNRAVCAICLMDFDEPPRKSKHGQPGHSSSLPSADTPAAGPSQDKWHLFTSTLEPTTGPSSNTQVPSGSQPVGDEVKEEKLPNTEKEEPPSELEPLRLLPCGHVYHKTCIDPWLTGVSGRCPTCQAKVELSPRKRQKRRRTSTN